MANRSNPEVAVPVTRMESRRRGAGKPPESHRAFRESPALRAARFKGERVSGGRMQTEDRDAGFRAVRRIKRSHRYDTARFPVEHANRIRVGDRSTHDDREGIPRIF